jgi:hypothetical protein
MMFLRICSTAVLLLVVSFSAHARFTCADVLKALSKQLVDATCFASADLTTNNEQTTPLDNSLPGLPPFAYTPRTDRNVISPNPPHRTAITKIVPGLQIQARIASDPTGQARFLLRLPNDWNGRLVVAGASGTRSEFNGDFAWSDYVVQKGYAYASQNKGVLNLQLSNAADPLACRLNPDSGTFVRFYANDPAQVFTRWTEFMIKAGQLAREGVKAAYGQAPRYTYAVGTSNGGYQVRRAIETAPKLFDGGVDWEGTFVDEHAPNLLTDLPPAVLNFPDYRTSGFNTTTTAAKNIVAAGYPPDIPSNLGAPTTLWNRNWISFWEVTLCQWQKRLDPGYDTYGSGMGTYNYISRLSFSNVGAEMAAFANSGNVRRPLATVAGTMDALLPIDHHARAYARKVASASQQKGDDDDGDRDSKRSAYRLYEVQNGSHIETYKQDSFSQFEFIQPHAQRAFDLIVQQVERGSALPPSQCIPRGGSISDSPAQPGHCASLLAP